MKITPIGPTEATPNPGATLGDISSRKTLYLLDASSDFDKRLEIVPNKTSVKEVLEAFKPEVTVDGLKDEEGFETHETFVFTDMSDFTEKGLVEQSELMQKMALKEKDLKQIESKLHTPALRRALADPETRQLTLDVLQQLLELLPEED